MYVEDELTQTTPGLAIVGINLDNLMQVFGCLWELLAGPKHHANGVQGPNGLRVVTKGMFVRLQCLGHITHGFCKAPWILPLVYCTRSHISIRGGLTETQPDFLVEDLKLLRRQIGASLRLRRRRRTRRAPVQLHGHRRGGVMVWSHRLPPLLWAPVWIQGGGVRR